MYVLNALLLIDAAPLCLHELDAMMPTELNVVMTLTFKRGGEMTLNPHIPPH